MTKKISLFILILITVFHVYAQQSAIIPKPMEYAAGKGNFVLDKSCVIQFDASNKEIARIATFFSEYLATVYDMKLDKTMGEKTIQFKIISSSNLGKEGYLLKVSDKTVVIVATEPNGLFYGMQTVKQMLPVEAKKRHP